MADRLQFCAGFIARFHPPLYTPSAEARTRTPVANTGRINRFVPGIGHSQPRTGRPFSSIQTYNLGKSDMTEEPNKNQLDISRILEDWKYNPGQLNVRRIDGDDNEPRIQIRLDLGILQLYTSGRPDGQRPEGYPSYLDYCEARLDAEQLGEDAPAVQIDDELEEEGPEPFVLGEEDCRILREEAAQYYHRYMALAAARGLRRRGS